MSFIQIILLLTIFFMAWTSRMAGGGKPKLPDPCDELLFALPVLFFWPVGGLWTIAAYFLTAGAKRMGTAPFLDMGYDTVPNNKKSVFTVILSPLKGKISDYWYDFLGNLLIGFVSGVPVSVLLFAHGHHLSGYIIILAGSSRVFAYAAGWAVYPNYYGMLFGKPIVATELAEYLTGAFIGMGIMAAYNFL